MSDICRGPGFNLLITRNSVLALHRIDERGNLIDSIPRVHRDIGLSLSYFHRYSYVDATWSEPYFYIFESRQDTLFYTRITEDLKIYDESPVPFWLIKVNPGIISISDGNFWFTQTTPSGETPYAVSMYTIPNSQPTVDAAPLDIVGTERLYHSMPSGMFVLAKNTTDSTLEIAHISTDGTVTHALPVSTADYRVRSIRFVSCGVDSSLCYWLDRATDTECVIRYMVLSPEEPTWQPEIRSHVLTGLFADSYIAPYLNIASSGQLLVVGNYRYDLIMSGFAFCLDYEADSICQAGRIQEESFEDELQYVRSIYDQDSVYYMYSSRCSLARQAVARSNPLYRGPAQEISFAAADHRCPTLLADDGAVSLVWQEATPDRVLLEGLRYSDAASLTREGPIDITGTDSLLYRPWLYDLGDTLALSWLNATKGEDGTLSFTQRLTGFADTHIPLDAGIDLGPVNISLWGDQDYKPCVRLHDAGSYINMATRVVDNSYGSGTLNRLYSIEGSDWRNPVLIREFTSGGYASICDFGPSPALLSTEVTVLGYNEWGFPDTYSGIYRQFTLTDSTIESESTVEQVESDITLCPLDVFTSRLAEQDFISRRCEDEIVSLNYSDTSFTPVVDLSPYTGGGYADAAGFDRGSLIPVETDDYFVVVLQGGHKQLAKFLIFDKSWNYLDSARINYQGIFNEVSDFVYSSEDDAIVFAYSSWLPNPFGSNQVIIQSATFSGPTAVDENETLLPETLVLAQNYPNPFNPSTTIEYQLPVQQHVNISVYNILGQIVRTLVNESRSAGRYKIVWDGSNASGNPVSSGVYLYRISTGTSTLTRKMILLK